MREDLRGQPLVRQFITRSRKVAYNGGRVPSFHYFDEDHDEDHDYLPSIMTIMIHAGAIYDITFNRVPRYNFRQEFVEYLIGNG
ncbi:hypothetical protein [Rhizobium bangladeshense]|nr:hypothetical protein [Rhizobium bangladeshense]MBX4900368.1 hypothetical protein [Rhizobium bangladeshense]MBX4912569.1 hypothetical protein [Rhizobium bangladeshense]